MPDREDRIISYREAVREAMMEEMAKDDRVFLMGEDVADIGGVYGASEGLFERFGAKRVRNTPISESAIVGAGIGAALVGMRPIAEIMSINFATLAMDQIANQCAKLCYMFGGNIKLPLVIRTQGGTGRSAAAQHSQSLEAWFAHVPGLKVIMPSMPYDAKGLLKSAIRDNSPVLFIEHIMLYNSKGPVPSEEYLLPISRADVEREGRDLTIIATGRMVVFALAVAEKLASEGYEVEVVDPRTLVPLDEETILDSVRRTGRALVVYEACRTCGFGAEIASTISEKAFEFLDGPVVRVAGADVPIPYSPALEKLAIPTEEDIERAARKLLEPS